MRSFGNRNTARSHETCDPSAHPHGKHSLFYSNALCPTMGNRMLAQTLARAGLHLGTTSVGWILKEKPVPPPPQTTRHSESTPRVVTAKRPDHVWHIDLTVVPTGAGMWCAMAPSMTTAFGN